MNKHIKVAIIVNMGMLVFGEVILFGLFGERTDCSQPMIPFSMLCMEGWSIFAVILNKYLAPLIIFAFFIFRMISDIKRIKRDGSK